MELSTILTAMIDHDYYRGYVSDYASEYGEPGYSTRGGPVILGDWWCRCEHGPESAEDRARDNFRPLHGMEYHYPRVFARLEEEGCDLEWSDEWYVDYNYDKAYRTEPDSYSWQPSILWVENGDDPLTPDDDAATILDAVVNNTRMAIPRPMLSEDDLIAEGFVEYACGYENGWYPGQNDNPEDVTRLIRETYGDEDVCDVVFYLSNVGQFDIGFCAFYRVKDEDDDEESDEESEG